MSTYSDVFARKEMKYRLSAKQHRCLLAAVEEHMELSEYGFSQVRSLYFDTPEYAIIERSLDKPLYKEKLRLRTYGEATDNTQAFLEIKKKFEGIVYKRRVSMTLAAANAYLGGESYKRACMAAPLDDPLAAEQSLSRRSLQIAAEIDFFRERYERLAPSMLVICDRGAYADPLASELRITFDAGIVADSTAKSIRLTEDSEPLIEPGEVIMEVKNAGPLPTWLVDALSAARAFPQSFSKYGAAYLSLVGNQSLRTEAEAFVPVASAALLADTPQGRHAKKRSKFGFVEGVKADSPRHAGMAPSCRCTSDAITAPASRGRTADAITVSRRTASAKADHGRHGATNERKKTYA
ncbi:polyphosphate polymerase domain-containing protein [Raoultibacter phocaeensis]|uniref:polyphosphate polymerase domain-containing protein n=1 Tax=Raoultibacter phocaeensis TaxID=2479841 RepID=UPI00111A3E10|nr:polyphosphate polymerase domain-containing protein [Raoultibacter phocaeensis]